jgi:hypothetical protein
MEVFYNSIKCSECRNVLEAPVILPCGDSVCKKHVKAEENNSEFRCKTCNIVHAIPTGGFCENKALSAQLTAKTQMMRLCPQYERAFSSFKNLEKLVDELKIFRKDPYFVVNKSIGELKMETDLLREEYKLKIDQRAERIIKDLEAFDDECKNRLSLENDVSDKLDALNLNTDRMEERLDKWRNCLASFDSTEDQWKCILDETDKERTDLEVNLNEMKKDLFLNGLNEHELRVLEFTQFELNSDRK